MALNVIARGIIFNFVFNLIIAYILIHYEFEISNNTFTILLVINLLLVTIHAGMSSKKYKANAEINALFIGFGSACIIFLFISQFVSLSWEINALIVTIWMFFGYIGGAIGSRLVKTPKLR